MELVSSENGRECYNADVTLETDSFSNGCLLQPPLENPFAGETANGGEQSAETTYL